MIFCPVQRKFNKFIFFNDFFKNFLTVKYLKDDFATSRHLNFKKLSPSGNYQTTKQKGHTMNITRRDYFPVHKDLGAFLDNFFRNGQDDTSFVDTSSWAPPVDIKEESSRFLVIADIPGVNKEDIQVALEHNILTLKGERHFEKTENNNGYTRTERAEGKFYRRFSLPQTADDSKISAKYKNGVLEISIPKKEVHVGKKIEIAVEE